jgi:hypothetical protein
MTARIFILLAGFAGAAIKSTYALSIVDKVVGGHHEEVP